MRQTLDQLSRERFSSDVALFVCSPIHIAIRMIIESSQEPRHHG